MQNSNNKSWEEGDSRHIEWMQNMLTQAKQVLKETPKENIIDRLTWEAQVEKWQNELQKYKK